jgi:glyoxylase-like metal-dependent hydrolase (beta-lactamase superfamily II)
MLFTGDTLFIGGTGRTDFQGGSAGLLYDNVVKKLFCYPDSTIVYPAHDYSGKSLSTIGEEKKWNPNVGVKITKSEFIENERNKSRSYPKKIDIAVPANMKCGQTSTF